MSKMSELALEFQNEHRELIETDDLEELEKEREKFMKEKAYEAAKERLKEELIAEYGKVYTTTEMQEKFIVKSFLSPHVFVTRKSDHSNGTLQFTGFPRFYFNFLIA